MGILGSSRDNIIKAAEEIKNGGLVAFPTETVYGLGANGYDPIAVAKIFDVKNRPTFNPLILHINSIDQLHEIAIINNSLVEKIIKQFWPGPLTIVLPKKDIVPDIVTSGHETVAVRMPANPIALELIHRSGTPIAAPSANLFGRLSPTSAEHVENQLERKINIILDGGECKVGVESTIIQFFENKIVLLRPGGLPTEELENLMEMKIERNFNAPVIPNSPGQLTVHYAPNKPILFFDEISESFFINKKIGALYFSSIKHNFKFEEVKILSASGNPHEAAANLFKYLHEFEKSDVEIILCEKIQETGLGKAIMDRLRKAVNKYVISDINDSE